MSSSAVFNKEAPRRRPFLSRKRNDIHLRALKPLSLNKAETLLQGMLRHKPNRATGAHSLTGDVLFSSGVAMHTGARCEDRVIERETVLGGLVRLFGVVDGHGGDQCSTFVADELPKVIEACARERNCEASNLLDEAWGAALESSFAEVARRWDQCAIRTSGAVASLVIVAERSCLIAHAGDCKIVASIDGDSFVELTRDHRCSDPEEAERVESAGGVIFNGRVEGRLLPSRAFGDIDVRSVHSGVPLNCISPDPDISYYSFDGANDAFMIVASDGLFDVMTAARVVSLVRAHLQDHGNPAAAAQMLVDFAAKKSMDDISVLVLYFKAL